MGGRSLGGALHRDWNCSKKSRWYMSLLPVLPFAHGRCSSSVELAALLLSMLVSSASSFFSQSSSSSSPLSLPSRSAASCESVVPADAVADAVPLPSA